MANERADEQGTLIAKMIARRATPGDVARLNANFKQ